MGLSRNIITLVTFLVTFYMFSCVSSTEFDVGGEDGWIVPKSKAYGDMFNQWASKNRFRVGDTIRFKYKKDSVLVVSEEEYKTCKATKPELYSNNEDTIIKIERPGLYYFMSGVSGHCEKGQKMIVKVMEPESPPPPSSLESPPQPPPSPSPSSTSLESPPPPSSSSHPTSTPKKSNAMRTAGRFNGSGFVVFGILVISVFGLV